ncbi:MAG: hypothetical protein ACO3JL_08465 [Myxococcota bacterium]
MFRTLTQPQRGLFALLSLLAASIACVPITDAADAGHDEHHGSHDDGGTPMGDDLAEDSTDDENPSSSSDSCESASYDALLGTLVLSQGYTVAESAPLAPTVLAVAAVAEGASWQLFGLDSANLEVNDLGTWPTLRSEVTKVFSLLPESYSGEAYASGFLASHGSTLVAGYTGDFDPETFIATGELLVFDRSEPGTVSPVRLLAPNNYAAAFVGDTLLVNAHGLGEVGEETGVYGWRVGETSIAARFEDPAATYGGPVLPLPGGDVVLGGYIGDETQFFQVLADDLATTDAGVLLDDSRKVLGAPYLHAAPFGNGFAYLHGDFFNPVEAVRVVPFEGSAPSSASDVLLLVDDCTSVDLLAPLGDDLLVGISDPQGRRLVRVSRVD